LTEDLKDATNQGTTETGPSIRGLIWGGLSFLTVITLIMLFINTVGLDRLQQTIEDAGPAAPAAYVVIKAVTYVFAPLSAGPIQLSSGVLFGLWPGVFLSLIGEVIGGSFSFWIARLLGRPVVVRLVGKDGMKRVDDFYEKNLGGWRALVYARLFLFSVYDFVSYATGLSRTSYLTYLWVSIFIGFIPTFVVVGVGTTLALDTTLLMAAFAVGGLLSLVPLLLHRQFQRHPTKQDSTAD
jgi:uncharacterized membrane protein YdjX (TVP38/TMEM64 family)